jgi:mRNA interferase HicA
VQHPGSENLISTVVMVMSCPYTSKRVDDINNNAYSDAANSKEFKRWLTQRGATFQAGKGSHLKVYLNDKQSVLPMHSSDLKTGTVEGIKKQLGLK